MITKKAQLSMTFNVGLLIPRLIFMIIATLTVVMIVKTFLIVNINVSEAEAKVMMGRLIYSPYCISYVHPETGRSYPGMIDLTKFSTDRIENCIHYGESNDYLAAKLTLYFKDNGETESRFLNERGYAVWKPLADMNGPGSSNYYSDIFYVLVDDKGKIRRAVLSIEVLSPQY
ncbi:MAG: hypothetical protein ABIG95_05820 [Candidatus Woesearchaeota archaeon]